MNLPCQLEKQTAIQISISLNAVWCWTVRKMKIVMEDYVFLCVCVLIVGLLTSLLG